MNILSLSSTQRVHSFVLCGSSSFLNLKRHVCRSPNTSIRTMTILLADQKIIGTCDSFLPKQFQQCFCLFYNLVILSILFGLGLWNRYVRLILKLNFFFIISQHVPLSLTLHRDVLRNITFSKITWRVNCPLISCHVSSCSLIQ